MTDLFEQGPPRFKGCTAICELHNLPCFDSKASAKLFHEKHCPGQAIIRMGRCEATGGYHFVCKARGPSGDSWGGNKREL